MARHPAPHSISEKALSRRVPVTIHRDITATISKVVWQHELPILQAIFDDVQELPPESLDDGYSPTQRPDMLPYNKTMDAIPRPSSALGVGFVFIGDPQEEYDRLTACYGRPSNEEDGKLPWAEKIYGRFQSGGFASKLGRATLDDLPDAQLRSLVVDYGYAPEPHKDASEAEKKEAWEKRKALAKMTHPELVKVAEEIGVEIG